MSRLPINTSSPLPPVRVLAARLPTMLFELAPELPITFSKLAIMSPVASPPVAVLAARSTITPADDAE
jgi:hypothetical protein